MANRRTSPKAARDSRQDAPAWTFLVVSSDQQADTLAHQEAWAKQVAVANGWPITRTFKATSTGKSGARKLLEDLLAELRRTPKGERPARVLMIRLDRTGRGLALEPLAALSEIYRLGVHVHTREDGDVTIQRASDAIKPILRVLTGALENEARRDKSLNMWQRVKAEGRRGFIRPYGIMVDEKGFDVVEEREAKFVREAFKMRAAGAGWNRITTYMRDNAPPRTLRDGSERTMRFSRGTLPQMLANTSYRGLVVPEQMFDAAQTVDNGPRIRDDERKRFFYPLTGGLKCFCGFGMAGQASGGGCSKCAGGEREHNHRRVRYYYCPELHENLPELPFRSKRGRPTSKGPRWLRVRAEHLEDQFTALLNELAFDDSAFERVAAQRRLSSRELNDVQKSLREVAKQVAVLEASREKVWSLFERGHVREDDIQSRLDRIKSQEAALRKEEADLRARIGVHERSKETAEDVRKLCAAGVKKWPALLRELRDTDGESDRSAIAAKERLARELVRAVSAYVGGLTVSATGQLLAGNSRG